MIKLLQLFFLIILFVACKPKEFQHFSPVDSLFNYGGRTLEVNGNRVLVSAASYVEFKFTGDSCIVDLINLAAGDNYNYVSIEIDGKYIGRIKVAGDSIRSIPIQTSTKINSSKDSQSHVVRIFKATEALNGQVIFAGARAEKLERIPARAKRKIEFIGNSITSGMAVDASMIPCDSGQWYDQHNAYLAYGPLLARSLDADFMLSSISGVGVYRTWNMDEPNMREAYESAYLDRDSSVRWNFNDYQPDLVSICLGTNDLSDGDGKNPRKPFDSTVFVNSYLDLLRIVYHRYPNAKLALLTSPMISGEKATLFFRCLNRIKLKAEAIHAGKKIAIFDFPAMTPHGCSYHPDARDHEIMANLLKPFIEEVFK
ncbi:MAG: GDSL family lipase [Chitinophagaceae bacterium]|nr:GDSL family lipase [Chitinophagaceae bacterium]